MIITIDGPSGTGKSTMAKLLARELGFAFFDTGALYRSFAWWLLEQGILPQEGVQRLSDFDFGIEETTRGRRYFVGDKDITDEIRTAEVSQLASVVAAIEGVRGFFLPIQRLYGRTTDSVFEGRDVGSVVFPDAEIKIFLTASAQVRAERRHAELIKSGKVSSSYQEVQEDLQERDQRDSSRKIAPLQCPEGAFVLDTSELSMQQVLDILLEHVRSKLAGD